MFSQTVHQNLKKTAGLILIYGVIVKELEVGA